MLAVMACQLDYALVGQSLASAGIWFLAIVLLWAGLYVFNAATWYILIGSTSEDNEQIDINSEQTSVNNEQSGVNTEQSGVNNERSSVNTEQANLNNKQATFNGKRTRLVRRLPFSFLWLYKITVSGFARNYATPGGLMGGEPYRVMSLKPFVGTERASSSVILYAMTHIFSHFLFWLLSIIVFLFTEPLTTVTASVLAASTVFCGLGVWFFHIGYKRGLAARLLGLLSHVPGAKRWAQAFIAKNGEKLSTIDRQIAALHSRNRRTFIAAVGLELACRVLSSFEIMFVLLVFTPDITFAQSLIILAFTSLFANLLFFMPLQLGGREGGFLMSATTLALTANAGIFLALIVRLRELVWTAIGLLLIKVGGGRLKA